MHPKFQHGLGSHPITYQTTTEQDRAHWYWRLADAPRCRHQTHHRRVVVVEEGLVDEGKKKRSTGIDDIDIDSDADSDPGGADGANGGEKDDMLKRIRALGREDWLPCVATTCSTSRIVSCQCMALIHVRQMKLTRRWHGP